MNAYRRTPERKTARSLTIVSGLFFWIFSFTYLAFNQACMMRIAIEQFISPDMEQNRWAVAAVITTVLWLFGFMAGRLYSLPGKYVAFSYLPSYLMLGALTSFNAEMFAGMLPVSTFLWVLGAVLLFYLLGFIKRNLDFREIKQTYVEGFTSNLIITSLLCILTVSIGNTNENFYHEVNILCALHDGDNERALLIGNKSVETDKEVTALRAVALHRMGQMGERLFEYPQSYGADGLKSAFFQESGADYQLASLLLAKDLSGFHAYLNRNPQNGKHYTEALILYKHLHPELSFTANDEEINTRFRAYLKYRGELQQSPETKKYPQAEKNRMQREYGDTYWWYYMYH